jgi:translation initiation factor 3 subunit C
MWVGPPENSRDHIMAAALAMKSGDWKTCEKHIVSLSIWSLCSNSDAVLAMLRTRIKEESLRTYLFAFSGFFDSMSLETLRCAWR